MERTFIGKNPSVLWFLLGLSVFTVMVSVMSEAAGTALISTSFLKTLGKTLCLCLVAVAMDVVWGYCGILSLGHFAFFGLGGYAIGMWLMYARTEIVIRDSLAGAVLPPTEAELSEAVAAQIFGVKHRLAITPFFQFGVGVFDIGRVKRRERMIHRAAARRRRYIGSNLVVGIVIHD